MFAGLNGSPIGSFYDGSKTGGLNEMDCFYVINGANIDVKIGSKESVYRICVLCDSDEREITPREINNSLVKCMREALCTVKRPEGWTHGGYASPEFSCVRCSGPAVTAMFCNLIEDCLSLEYQLLP